MSYAGQSVRGKAFQRRAIGLTAKVTIKVTRLIAELSICRTDRPSLLPSWLNMGLRDDDA